MPIFCQKVILSPCTIFAIMQILILFMFLLSHRVGLFNKHMLAAGCACTHAQQNGSEYCFNLSD